MLTLITGTSLSELPGLNIRSTTTSKRAISNLFQAPLHLTQLTHVLRTSRTKMTPVIAVFALLMALLSTSVVAFVPRMQSR